MGNTILKYSTSHVMMPIIALTYNIVPGQRDNRQSQPRELDQLHKERIPLQTSDMTVAVNKLKRNRVAVHAEKELNLVGPDLVSTTLEFASTPQLIGHQPGTSLIAMDLI